MALSELLQQLYPHGEPAERDLDFVEVFAGDAAVSQGMRLFGFAGVSLDARYEPDHDVLSRRGFLLLLSLVARLRPGGLLWAAPPLFDVGLHGSRVDPPQHTPQRRP